ncbi:MAG: hypothetical protein ACLT0Y_02100 [Christensenellales bacterium]
MGYSINNTIVVFDRIVKTNRSAGSPWMNWSIPPYPNLNPCIYASDHAGHVLALYILGPSSIKEFALSSWACCAYSSLLRQPV